MHESIDARYAALSSRIGKFEAALILFEDRQDGCKEKMEVVEAEIRWERRRIGVVMGKYHDCNGCLHKIEKYLHERWQEGLEQGQLALQSATWSPSLNLPQFPSSKGTGVSGLRCI